jgi:hypothetical protein
MLECLNSGLDLTTMLSLSYLVSEAKKIKVRVQTFKDSKIQVFIFNKIPRIQKIQKWGSLKGPVYTSLSGMFLCGTS